MASVLPARACSNQLKRFGTPVLTRVLAGASLRTARLMLAELFLVRCGTPHCVRIIPARPLKPRSQALLLTAFAASRRRVSSRGLAPSSHRDALQPKNWCALLGFTMTWATLSCTLVMCQALRVARWPANDSEDFWQAIIETEKEPVKFLGAPVAPWLRTACDLAESWPTLRNALVLNKNTSSGALAQFYTAAAPAVRRLMSPPSWIPTQTRLAGDYNAREIQA